MPLVRYRTGDITRILEGDCECGLILPRIDELKGRTDDRVVIGAAEKYYPSDFDILFDEIEEIKDYWIEIISENDKDTLVINIYTNKPSNKLKEKVIQQLFTNDAIKIDVDTTKTVNMPKIIFVDKLPVGAKRRRLVDKRRYIL